MKIKFQTPKKRRKNNQPARSEKISTPTNQPITENKPAPKENKPEVTENKPAPPVTNQPMQFSQPVELGSLILDFGVYGGYIIKNATYNDGNYYRKYRKDNTSTYGKGLAQFGKGKDSLYIHYDVEHYLKVGSKTTDNVVQISTEGGGTISQVNTNSGIIFYPIWHGIVSSDCIIIGKRADGKFIKYIDTSEITKRYFGTNSKLRVFYGDASFIKNQIIIPYTSQYLIQHLPMSKFETKKGEFRFKWDEAAQWFSVEQIKY